MKIIFFIGSLVSGGKERRFIELLSYLKKENKYKILVLTTSTEMHFPQFQELDIETILINKNKSILGLNLPFEIIRIIHKIKPDFVHTWGRIQTFYVLPSRFFFKFILVNGQITNASKPKNSVDFFIDKLNFKFSHSIVANSQAGLKAYNPPLHKSLTIRNGMDFSRFEQLPSKQFIKDKFQIRTQFAIIMVATFSENKDYMRFFETAIELLKLRDDVTFLAVGTFHKDRNVSFLEFQKRSKDNSRIIMTGVILEVEALVNACDIGVLFTNNKVHGEGISNSILEYMALAKPVIANESGGTKEILIHKKNGYLVKDESPVELATILDDLLNNTESRKIMGDSGRSIFLEEFSSIKMGSSFSKLYHKLITDRN
jgi:glycosyltransferase involved in cell wall biosynthesis